MIYIYDILLNFADDKIYEFFEWDVNDSIEHIKKIPIIKVNSKVLYDLKENDVIVNQEFLKKIDHKSEIFCERKKEVIEYACLFTDEKQVIAIEFDETGKNLYRSHLLLDEELEILDVASRLDEQEILYQLTSKNKNRNYFTRSEESMKRYLLKELKHTYQNKNIKKLSYLYSEYFGNLESDIKVMYQTLIDSFKIELNDKHYQIYQLLKLSHTKKKV